MTLFKVLLAAIYRKIDAVVAEYRLLVSEAKATEYSIVSKAEAEAKAIQTKAKAETKQLYDEVINKIAKL